MKILKNIEYGKKTQHLEHRKHIVISDGLLGCRVGFEMILFGLGFLLLVVSGHVLGALILYLAHRFVFHGNLGKLPVLSHFKKLHLKHHRFSYSDNRNEFLIIPIWGKATILFSIGLVGLFSPGLALGLFTFTLLYSHRHYAIHNEDNSSHFHFHHHHHHRKPKVNFSGVYPVIDRLFGTYETPKKYDARKKKRADQRRPALS